MKKTAKILKYFFIMFVYVIFYLFNHISFRVVITKNLRRKVDFCRTRLMALMGAKIGRNVYISKGFFTTAFSNIKLGDNGTIGMNCQFYSYGDGITIGNNFLIGSDFVVHTSEHTFENPNIPIIYQESKYAPVIIGNNVYIGSGVSILSGVTVHDNVIVATGSVVNKDLESSWIYAGVPAKKIKRFI